MSFLDKMAKAVSDTVDRGKKEVDQFMRAQKVKGEISQTEHQIQDASAQVQRVKQEIGEKAIEMVRAGTLVSTELQLDDCSHAVGLATGAMVTHALASWRGDVDLGMVSASSSALNAIAQVALQDVGQSCSFRVLS